MTTPAEFFRHIKEMYQKQFPEGIKFHPERFKEYASNAERIWKTYVLPTIGDVGMGLMSWVAPQSADAIKSSLNQARRAANLQDYITILGRLAEATSKITKQDTSLSNRLQDVEDRIYKIANYQGGNNSSSYKLNLMKEHSVLEGQKKKLQQKRDDLSKIRGSLMDAANLASVRFASQDAEKGLLQSKLGAENAIQNLAKQAIEERINEANVQKK